MDSIQIKTYQPAFGDAFKRISYDWLEKYFGIEEEDRILMENHYEKIIGTGGDILFALDGEQVVGACALIKHGDDLYELAKMGVNEAYQGRKIGRKLAEAVLKRAEALGAKKVFLESSQKLKSALALYQKLGFKPDPSLNISPYSRCNVQLAVTL